MQKQKQLSVSSKMAMSPKKFAIGEVTTPSPKGDNHISLDLNSLKEKIHNQVVFHV
jgi:hypothetical protein